MAPERKVRCKRGSEGSKGTNYTTFTQLRAVFQICRKQHVAPLVPQTERHSSTISFYCFADKQAFRIFDTKHNVLQKSRCHGLFQLERYNHRVAGQLSFCPITQCLRGGCPRCSSQKGTKPAAGAVSFSSCFHPCPHGQQCKYGANFPALGVI